MWWIRYITICGPARVLAKWAFALAIVIEPLILALLCLDVQARPSSKSASKPLSHKLEIRDYRVYGKTAGELVTYMRRRPFAGDNGPAMANIRPRYKLTTLTKRVKASCKVERVELAIRFVMTLPKSMQSKEQSKRTKQVWRSFRAFTQRHEEVHRKIYLQCARTFIRKARKLKGQKTCYRLKREVKQLLKAEEKICDKKHLAFDRRDFRKVPGLALFRQANKEKLLAKRRLKQAAAQKALKKAKSARLSWRERRAKLTSKTSVSRKKTTQTRRKASQTLGWFSR